MVVRLPFILKNRPDWQKNLWNLIGGKIEIFQYTGYDGATTPQWETPHEAMVREFREETGVEFYDWEKFAVTRGPSLYNPDNWEVHYFKGFSSDAQNKIRWITDEMPSVFRLSEIPSNLTAHNQWLIPMSLNSDNVVFTITEEQK